MAFVHIQTQVHITTLELRSGSRIDMHIDGRFWRNDTVKFPLLGECGVKASKLLLVLTTTF